MEQVWLATRRVFREFHFVVAAVVLLLAALLLNGSVQYLQWHFRKLPVTLSQELFTIPTKLGTWLCVSKGEDVDAELAESLGTNKFIFRTYVNTAVVPQSAISALANGTKDQIAAKVGEIRAQNSDAVVSLAVTYYTGKADTVAHIPERCYVADGYDVVDTPQTLLWNVPTANPPADKLEVRYISFEDRAGMSQVIKNVGYFFHANGQYISSPTEVRMKLQDLFEKYAYYTKVELMTTSRDSEKSKVVMANFLRVALPEIEKTFPDWNKYKNTH
jgi:hypothetical protein